MIRQEDSMKKKFYLLSMFIGIIMTGVSAVVTGTVGNFLTTPPAGAEVQGHATGMEYALPLLIMILASELVLLVFALAYYFRHKNPGSKNEGETEPAPQLKGGSVIGSFLLGNVGYLILGPLIALLAAALF